MSSLSAPPAPHPECTSSRHAWIGSVYEDDKQWAECENRPWANLTNRDAAGCSETGGDFVLHNPRVHLRFFWRDSDKKLEGVVHFDNDCEGPPKGAHGASIALVFDEVLAYVVWRRGIGAFTANLNLNLRKMVPHRSTLRFEAGVTEKKGKKIFTLGRILSPDAKTVYADCTGLWIEAPHMNATQRLNPGSVHQLPAAAVQLPAKL